MHGAKEQQKLVKLVETARKNAFEAGIRDACLYKAHLDQLLILDGGAIGIRTCTDSHTIS